MIERTKFILTDSQDPYLPLTLDWLHFIVGLCKLTAGIVYLIKFTQTGADGWSQEYHHFVAAIAFMVGGSLLVARAFGVACYSKEDGYVASNVIR